MHCKDCDSYNKRLSNSIIPTTLYKRNKDDSTMEGVASDGDCVVVRNIECSGGATAEHKPCFIPKKER